MRSDYPNVSRLRVEYKKNPLGMDEACPRFSYVVENCQRQVARRIEVRDESGFACWDSGWEKDDSSLQIEYRGEALKSFTRYDWRVKFRDENQRESPWSGEPAFFETGFLGRPWSAKWIGGRTGPAFRLPVQRILRDFRQDSGKIRRARLYITALGLYEAFVNGRRVSDDCLTPGWTDYFKRVQYQVYDVRSLLVSGSNTLGVHLAEGWYNGRIARQWRADTPTYGEHNLLKCELHLEYADGTSEKVVSDKNFMHLKNEGAIRYSDIYDGEWYEAWRDQSWKFPSGNREFAEPCGEFSHPAKIVWQSGASVRRVAELKPRKIIRRAGGNYIVDFGQNLAGRERIRLKNTVRGATIVIKHGEMLNPDGSLYVENLRTALATTVYTCGKNDEEIYEPTFTFYGFRYLEISGWPGRLKKDQITAQVLSSDLEPTGRFSCSDPALNRLNKNITWGQRGNFVDIPSDCPQRDERYGWTGDTQVFAGIATYNADCAAFYTKWIDDLNSCQQPDGVYPHIVPSPYKGYKPCSGWGDAGVICPWVMFEKYGDKRLLRKYFRNMKRWLDCQLDLSGGGPLVKNSCYGDWLNLDDPTSEEYISTAYLAGMTVLLGKIATVIGRKKEATSLGSLGSEAKKVFQKNFISAQGVLKEKSQTALLLALHFDLLPEKIVGKAVSELVKNIRAREVHLSTGFLGTPLLLPVLSRFGETGLAYELLLQPGYPGWLYPVAQGATTSWERWNSYTHEKGFGNVAMNSFNHYAYGAIAEWFYQSICGIKPDVSSAECAGFKHFVLAPEPGRLLRYAKAEYNSAYGQIKSAWEKNANKLTWRFTIPANTTATIMLPFPALENSDQRFQQAQDGRLLAGPGSYRLSFSLKKQ